VDSSLNGLSVYQPAVGVETLRPLVPWVETLYVLVDGVAGKTATVAHVFLYR